MGLEGSFSKIFFLGQSVPTAEVERPEEYVAKLHKFPSPGEAGVKRLAGPETPFLGSIFQTSLSLSFQ